MHVNLCTQLEDKLHLALLLNRHQSIKYNEIMDGN